jgi:hypothetical protein
MGMSDLRENHLLLYSSIAAGSRAVATHLHPREETDEGDPRISSSRRIWSYYPSSLM